jgi:RHS repeat-associated protein
MVTDQNGNVVARHDYLPFGEEVPGGSPGRTSEFGASDGIATKFTGQYRDSETGVDYFHARYFTGALGRFNSPDPGNAGADLTDPQTWNGYAYVRNNPMAFVDPSGMSCTDPNDGTSCIVDNPPPACKWWQIWCWGGGGGSDSGGSSSDWSGLPSSGGVAIVGSIPQQTLTTVIQPVQGNSGPPQNSNIRTLSCSVAAPLIGLARYARSTVGFGVGANAGLGFGFGAALAVGVQFVADPSGNVGVAVNFNGTPGIGVFGASAMGGLQGSVSTAQTISQLKGLSYAADISVGAGPAIDLGISKGFSLATGRVDGPTTVTATIGPGVGTKRRCSQSEAHLYHDR